MKTYRERHAELQRLSKAANALQMQGKTHREIAAELNVPLSRVAVLLKEALMASLDRSR